MCLPVVAAAAAVGGGILQGFGAIQAGNAKASAYRTQAAEERIRADMIQRQSILDQTASQYEQRKQGEKFDQLQGAQNALYGQSGLLPDGSVMDVQADAARENAMDVAAMQWSSTVKAQNAGLETQAAYRNAAAADRAAKTARRSGMIGALSAGINSISGLAGAGKGTELGLKF